MIGIDPDGFDVRADHATVALRFRHPVNDAQQARQALVAMAQAADRDVGRVLPAACKPPQPA
jgi:putative heme iron utilization protein